MNTLLWRGRANKSVWRSRSKTSHDDVAEVAEMQQSHDVKLTSSPCALNDDDDEDDNSIMPCVLHTAERLSSPREAVAAHPAAWPQHISADDLLDAPPMPRRRLTLSSSPTSCFLCGEGGDATVSFPQRSRGDDDDDRDDVDDDDDDDDDDLMEASTDPFMLCSEEVGSPCSLMDEGSGAPPLAAMSLTCCPQRTPRVCDEVLMVDGLHSATPPRGDDGDDVLRQLEESPLPHHHQRIFSGQVGDDLLDLVEVCSSTHTVSTEEVAGTSTTISCGRSLGATPRARDFLADGNRYNTIMSRRYNVSLAQSPATNTTTTNTTATSAAMMGRSTGAYVGTSTNITNTTNTGGMLPPLRLDVVAGRSTTFASCACDGPEEESEAAPSRGMLRKMPTSSSSTQQQQQHHHHSTNCPAAAVAAATSSVMERYQQQEYLLPTPLATTDDHLRAGLYHLLLHPPSAQLGSTDACQRYFHALQMLCPHQRVGWERVRLLLQPGDLIHHGDLYPADFLLPFSEFLNFVEIASVRYRAQRMF